jgi:uncharacterized protein YggL (DUF469 family)
MVDEDMECIEWLEECRKAFPKIKRYKIFCDYAKISNKALGRVEGSIQMQRLIDPESLLLNGKAKMKIKRKTIKEFKIKINENLRKIDNSMLRKQAVQYVIIHELMHIENKDLLTLSKKYRKRKTKKIHKKEFKNIVLKKFNTIRQLNGMPRIRNIKHMELAMNEIFSRVQKEASS